uniref:Urocanate hydratase n=1 Tax=Ascaris lumbricoides TaxID=6252 RepID=A0A0M3IGF3_ASCLU
MDLKELTSGNYFHPLPEYPSQQRAVNIAHAPVRNVPLNNHEKKQAVANILRYVPREHHKQLANEFADELKQYGHIYAFRFMPNYPLKAPPIDEIPGKSMQARAIILMILNNLDPEVAQFPQELVIYGGNGQIFSNWLQFRLVMHYLSTMNDEQTLVLYSGHPLGLFPSHRNAPRLVITNGMFRLVMHYLSTMNDEQTLVLYSGHPLGLFPSHRNAPRLVITNGMMIPNYSTKELYDKFFALGVTQYGQMTAGSYSYIGPQGIVHGTTITVMNAGRKYLGVDNLAGKVFVTSGLGGMSGAQAKAACIAGCVGVIAEISEAALKKRHSQGWLDVYSDKLDEVIQMIREYREKKQAISIGYLGNVVDLWERLVKEEDLPIELGSDQTSLHNPFNGGYYPVGITFEESNNMMINDPSKFKSLVQKSLRRQIAAIDTLVERGLHFWDYGNAFLVECARAGADVLAPEATDDKSFKYPSYIQGIMGDIFSMGFGPFRWVCTSGEASDLKLTDELACEVLDNLMKQQGAGSKIKKCAPKSRPLWCA